MKYCCAPNCRKNDAEGSRLFRFPKDSIRREVWVKNTRNDNWTPNSGSRLCEVGLHRLLTVSAQRQRDKYGTVFFLSAYRGTGNPNPCWAR